jgi:hypothetical protein
MELNGHFHFSTALTAGAKLGCVRLQALEKRLIVDVLEIQP